MKHLISLILITLFIPVCAQAQWSQIWRTGRMAVYLKNGSINYYEIISHNEPKAELVGGVVTGYLDSIDYHKNISENFIVCKNGHEFIDLNLPSGNLWSLETTDSEEDWGEDVSIPSVDDYKELLKAFEFLGSSDDFTEGNEIEEKWPTYYVCGYAYYCSKYNNATFVVPTTIIQVSSGYRGWSESFEYMTTTKVESYVTPQKIPTYYVEFGMYEVYINNWKPQHPRWKYIVKKNNE